jgi:hypothetical protein
MQICQQAKGCQSGALRSAAESPTNHAGHSATSDHQIRSDQIILCTSSCACSCCPSPVCPTPPIQCNQRCTSRQAQAEHISRLCLVRLAQPTPHQPRSRPASRSQHQCSRMQRITCSHQSRLLAALARAAHKQAHVASSYAVLPASFSAAAAAPRANSSSTSCGRPYPAA